LQAACYVGVIGETSPCSEIDQMSAAIRVFRTGNPLAPGEGLTIAVGYEKSMVPILTGTDRGIVRRNAWVAGLISFLIVFSIGLFAIVRLWLARGRDLWTARRNSQDTDARSELMPVGAHETIVVEYESPGGLRPAELGVIRDETANTLDVSATIVDLAVRGYVEITEIPKKGIFGKGDYELVLMKKTDGTLLAYEKKLLDGLFGEGVVGGGVSSVTISSLKDTFHPKLEEVKKALYEDVTKKGFFTENPQHVRVKYSLFALAVAALGTFLFFGGVAQRTGIMSGATAGAAVGLLLDAAVFLIVAIKGMAQRTAAGREAYRQIRGYETYVMSAEKHRQQFFEREGTFMEVLPYAMVFGATKQLASAMKALGVKVEQPGWYHGTGSGQAFNAALFSDSIGSFSSSFNSASMPASSSGSGGGGSSGGGGGGGGGGSW
jgi:uncharacterized membrane protein YgcG